jgi:hypothetical protein
MLPEIMSATLLRKADQDDILSLQTDGVAGLFILKEETSLP